VVFTIPFQRDFTLIGTIDQSFVGDPATVVPSEAEIDYLCSVVSTYFRTTVVTADAVWAYAGVRSLYDDCVAKLSLRLRLNRDSVDQDCDSRGAGDDGAARARAKSILLRVRSRQGGAGRSFG